MVNLPFDLNTVPGEPADSGLEKGSRGRMSGQPQRKSRSEILRHDGVEEGPSRAELLLDRLARRAAEAPEGGISGEGRRS